MAAEHAEGGTPSVAGEGDALVWQMFDQAGLGEALDHAADRRGGEVECLGDGCRGGGFAGLGQVVDDLEIVFDRAGEVAGDEFSHA